MVSICWVPTILVRELSNENDHGPTKISYEKKKCRVNLLLISKDPIPKTTSSGYNPFSFLALLSTIWAAFVSWPFPKGGKNSHQ